MPFPAQEVAFHPYRNEIRDHTANLLTEVCHNKQVEPDLQLISNQVMATSYSITIDEARLDIAGI